MVIYLFTHPFLPSLQTVSDSADCLCKFHLLFHNTLIIKIYKFLQRGGILDSKTALQVSVGPK